MLTRRQFMQRAATFGAMATAAPAVIWQAHAAAGTAEAAPAAAAANRTLVVLQLAGGNDTLNMVVPYKDGNYPSLRPSLHVDQSKVLPLGDELGLNPAMATLKPVWDAGQLAIVNSVGYPDPTYSHFSSMTVWQTASPKGDFADGWLGRYFKQAGAESKAVFRGLNVTGSLAPMLEAPGLTTPAIQNPASYRLTMDPRDAQARFEAWEDLQTAAKARRKYLPLIGSASVDAYQGTQALSRAVSSYQPAVDYADEPLSRSLRLLASVIVAQPGTKVGYVSSGGYDNHSNERRTHDSLLSNLSRALSTFQKDLVAHGKADDVLLVSWSEFGRRVKENGSQGTDHGDGGSMIVMGTGVKGGFYGDTPDLTRLDSNGSLRWSVDFRSVYATLLEGWLGVESKSILGGRFPQVSFLAG